ncbi:MAG: dihydrolipoyl dehydrogenase [Candidatus Cloacimonadota bacterium]|nr:MAG: dihydrolipoyl dehydrogenase [Candidatus Cloacimonadota bacterium]
MSNTYDLIVIGGGPGGYVASIRAAQLGMKVACVEVRKELGGTCLNVGCIPSKALLDSSEFFHQATHNFKKHGIEGKFELNLSQMMKRKDDEVATLTQGIAGLFKKNKITSYNGFGTLKGNKIVEVSLDGKNTELKSDKILLALGSEPISIPAFPIDEKRILSSTGALALKEVPKHLVVVGGGVIGLELGSVYKRLGAKVTVVEFMDQILAGMDKDVSKLMLKTLKSDGFEFALKSKVEAVDYKGDALVVKTSKDGVETNIDCDYCLVSIGRRPLSKTSGITELSINLTDRGFVAVDENFETNVKGIFAIGDLIEGPMLAHKAEEDGVVCVERISGLMSKVHYDRIPGVVYTHPEVATVGLTQEQAKEKGIQVAVGKFPFSALARAKVMNESVGFFKVIADKNTDQILGVHIVGPRASDLIAEAVLALEYKASSEDIARTCHAHPTLSEGMKEACLAVLKRTINM